MTPPDPAPARGRRSGHPDTRQQILDIAGLRFLTQSYQRVTLRAIATDAGVDVALVSYYFGSKRGLFGAVLDLTATPADVVAQALAGDLATMPQRLLGALLRLWEDPATGPPLQASMRVVAIDPLIAQAVRGGVEHEIIDRLADRLPGPRPRARAAIFAAQVSGIMFSRYVLRIEPIASMPLDTLVGACAPPLSATLQPHGSGSTYRPPRPDQRRRT